MRQRAALAERSFVQSEVEWRILHVEFRVARPHLAWLNTKHLFVELDTLLHVSHVQGQVCFQRLHCLLAFHFILLYIHIRISEYEAAYAWNYISVKAYIRFFKVRKEIQIRSLDKADWPVVRAIYLEGIATDQATLETESPAWGEWNAAHLPAPRIVAVSDEKVIGWAALGRVSARAVYAGVAEVSVYVANGARGTGVGRALLEKLISASEANNIWTLQANIFPENVASLALHKSCGFREVGRRERIGKMKGAWRDTILLERRSNKVGNC